MAACESAVSSGKSIRSNHSSQQGGGTQNNKIAFHLNNSIADPAIPHISGSAACAMEIAM